MKGVSYCEISLDFCNKKLTEAPFAGERQGTRGEWYAGGDGRKSFLSLLDCVAEATVFSAEMDHNVPSHLQFTIKAFKVSRLPVQLIQRYWSKRSTKLIAAGALASGGALLWAAGSLHAKLRTPNLYVILSYPSIRFRVES